MAFKGLASYLRAGRYIHNYASVGKRNAAPVRGSAVRLQLPDRRRPMIIINGVYNDEDSAAGMQRRAASLFIPRGPAVRNRSTGINDIYIPKQSMPIYIPPTRRLLDMEVQTRVSSPVTLTNIHVTQMCNTARSASIDFCLVSSCNHRQAASWLKGGTFVDGFAQVRDQADCRPFRRTATARTLHVCTILCSVP